MKARLASTTAPTPTKAAPGASAGDLRAADALLSVILETPALLDRLLNHPAVTARMEKILEDYDFVFDVKDDVKTEVDPRIKAVTDITTRLNVRLTALEAGKPKKGTPAAPAGKEGQLPL